MTYSGSDSVGQGTRRGFSTKTLLTILGVSITLAATITSIEYNLDNKNSAKRAQEYFNKMDRNHDGVISIDEWNSFYDSNLKHYSPRNIN